MKTITYVGPFDEVEIEQGANWRLVAHGASVEVPDALAESLLEQPDNWAEKPKKTTKAVPATTSEED